MIDPTRLSPQFLQCCCELPESRSSAVWGVPEAQFPRWREAAVLVLLHQSETGPQVLLTRRAEHLRHHAGQVSFPGGALDPTDASPEQAALRELHEEIGLRLEPHVLLGRLPGYRTISGFHVTPLLAWLDTTPKPLVVDPEEVAEVFSVPAELALSPDAYEVRSVTHQGRQYTIHSLDWEGRTIWGATAAMLVRLGQRLQAIADTER